MIRGIPQPKLISMIYEIYDSKWLVEETEKLPDEGGGEDEIIKNGKAFKFSDFFYGFLEKRYQIKDISLKASYDLLNAVQQNETKSLVKSKKR